MTRPHSQLPLTILAMVSLSSAAHAATLTVDPTAEAPAFKTIQAALDAAQAGDVISVKAGHYRERVKFKTGGTSAETPVVLQGEPGVVLDGSTEVKLDWQPAADVAPGAYRCALDFMPYMVTAEGKTVTTLDEKRTDPEKQHSERDNLRWPKMFQDGAGPAGWDGIHAMTIYLTKKKELLIRFKGDLDPRQMAITVAPKNPAVTIDGVNHCVVRGLDIRNAPYAVKINRSVGSVVENCVLTADYGVHLDEGSERCVVRSNEITLAPYTPCDPWQEGLWDNWQAVKNAGFYDRYAVRVMSSLGGHEISYNDIHDHWDGVETGYPGTPEQNGGLRVHHNRFVNIFDDAIETSGGQVDNRFHDNYFENSRIAIRIKGPQSGPLYIYRNVFMKNKSDMTVFYNKNDKVPPVELYVYHNTCTADVSIGTNYKVPEIVSTPNFHFYNNLFWCSTTLRRESRYPLPNWKSDHNLFLQAGGAAARPWPTEGVPGTAAKRAEQWAANQEQAKSAGIDQLSTWMTETPPGFVDAAAGNLALAEDSAARGKGADLSQGQARPLPGCEPGYFKGDKPDIGALQFGEAMPAVGPKAAPKLAVTDR